MSDLLMKRLLGLRLDGTTPEESMLQAAEEIERLRTSCQFDAEGKPLSMCHKLVTARAEVERLRAALYRIADPLTVWPTATDHGNPLQDAARNALSPGTGSGEEHG